MPNFVFSRLLGFRKPNLPADVKVELVPTNIIPTPGVVEQITGENAETYGLTDRVVLLFPDVHTAPEMERVFNTIRGVSSRAKGTIYGGSLAITLSPAEFRESFSA